MGWIVEVLGLSEHDVVEVFVGDDAGGGDLVFVITHWNGRGGGEEECCRGEGHGGAVYHGACHC